jgi:TP901 family phage tail tape measure protein
MTIISNLEVRVGIDISDFTRGMATVDNKISGFGKSIGTGIMALGSGISTIGDKMSTLGSTISNATRPLTDLANSGLDAAAGFQDIMVQLQTFGGLGGAQLEIVRQKALQLGADTKFSASDAANAMLELVKAGYSTEDSMTAASSALNLAAVGNMSLESAAGVVSSTLAQFKLDVSDAGDVVDTLAQAANASRADVSGMADGLKNVGVVASTMGFSMRDTAAALAVMSNAGIEGAEAGTQLKSALLNLSTTTTAQDQLKALGVTLYDSSGKMKDMDTIIDQLSASMKDFSPEDKTQALKNLGGAYGITALSALMAAGGTDKMIDSMIAAPAASDIAQKSMGTFNGVVESLKGSVETLLIEGLTPLMEDGLTPIVGKVTEVVNSITDWAGKNPQVASTIGAIVLGVGALGTGLAILGPIVGLIGTAIAGFGTIITVATGPVGLLALGIAGLVALLSNPDIQNGLKAWEGVFGNLKIILQAIVDDIKNKLNDVAVGFRSFVRDIGTVIDDLKGKAAAAQVVLGINVDVNTQIVQDTENSKNAAIFAKQLESDINASLASGGPLQIDVGTLNYAATANGGAGIEDLAKKIADPVAIQQAIDQAVANGDTGGLQALLPLQLKLSNDPHAEMQRLLTEALDVGGPNGQDAFNALVPMATEMQIDVPSLVDQYDKKLKEAASAKTYDVTVTANVHVNTNVDTAGFGVAAQTGGAQAASGSSIPGFASGGYINSSGLAYVHGGEMVLNPAQQAAFAGSGGGGTKVYNITVIGQAPHEVAALVSRANKEQDR